MDFDILDVINDATTESNAFENHPAREFSMEEQILYLNGLALVMNADGHIDSSEKEYIRILIKSMGLDESTLEDIVRFAGAPDKDTVQAFFRTFRRKPVAQLFLFDALMMTRRDGKVEDKEKAVVDKMAEQLEILKGTQQDIFDLFCHIKNRNWQESALYFNSHLLNPDHFKHLLDYHEVDFDELMEETQSIRTSRLLEILKEKVDVDIQWGEFSCEGSTQEASKITCNPVTLSNWIPNELVFPWLQQMLDRGAVRVAKGSVFLIEEDKEVLLFNVETSPFEYDQETTLFSLDAQSEEHPGACTDTLSVNFIRSININIDNVDALLSITGAKAVALAHEERLPMCNGKQVSAITKGHPFGVDGHPNAVSKVSGNFVEIRWCNHCHGGHGSTSSICNDHDRRFSNIDMSEMLTTHGFYLVK